MSAKLHVLDANTIEKLGEAFSVEFRMYKLLMLNMNKRICKER